MGKKILLGVTGSIAAYKAVALCRDMMAKGWDVWPVMTACAAQYVGPLTFRALTGHPVPVGTFRELQPETYEHLALAENAAALVIAPCTAATLARLAAGFADDILCCTALSVPDIPLVAAPAMNARMWRHPATQANVKTLQKRGAVFAGPCEGALACGDSGVGRLAPVPEILAVVERLISDD